MAKFINKLCFTIFQSFISYILSEFFSKYCLVLATCSQHDQKEDVQASRRFRGFERKVNANSRKKARTKCTFPSAASSATGETRGVLNIRVPYRSKTIWPHSRPRYNVRYTSRACARYRTGWRSHFGAIYFASFPASRYRSAAERVMDVGASFLRGTYETRGAPLRSSASDVGHFIQPSSPPPVPQFVQPLFS